MTTYLIRAQLLPDARQEAALSGQLDGCRELYNSLNLLCREEIEKGNPIPGPDELRDLAIDTYRGTTVDAEVLTDVADRVFTAFCNSLRRGPTASPRDIPA